MRSVKTLLVLVFMALFTAGALPHSSFANDEPDTGGLDTEPGLRLRVFWIGTRFDTSLSVQEGQSPNVDITVPGVLVTGKTVFEDTQEITNASKEPITHKYVAEWSGWIKATQAGMYHFKIDSNGTAKLMIGDEQVLQGKKELDAGWHPITLSYGTVSGRSKPMQLLWAEPGKKELAAIPTEMLKAPKFFFRPTQRGKKELMEGETRPGLGKKLVGVHPGYRVTNIRPGGMDMPVGGLGILSDGRLVVARFDAQTLTAPSPTTEPNGELWLLTNPTADDPNDVEGEKIAGGLYEPSGTYVIDDAIYVSQRNELSKFIYNANTKKWDKSVIASGWETNDFHQISAGLPWVPGPTEDHPGYFLSLIHI